MEYRKLGRCGLDVGVIGLGAEYLWDFSGGRPAPPETVTAVIDEALSNGANYIDVPLPAPGVRKNLGAALQGRRQEVIIAGHLGAVLENNQYTPHRDTALCEKFVDDLLVRLQTDYVDVLMLHCVDDLDDYRKVFDPAGLLGVAQRLQKEGKARFLGMSGHSVPVALEAVRRGYIDVLMFPVNAAMDILPGDVKLEATWEPGTFDRADAVQETSSPTRQDLYHTCAAEGVAIVAMKPYAAGRLFNPENPSGIVLTPVQCASYALSQPGVACIVPGCKDAGEMKAALAYATATAEERDYSGIDASALWKLRGACMYCNHCLPCPEAIDIAVTTRITDTASYSLDGIVADQYESLTVQASACTECGVCTDRCPFGVDVVANMRRAVELFGK
jgi:predicted aldo/keto reductase-like oxidoreductase